MRLFIVVSIVAVSLMRAQEDAAVLAWSGIGEAVDNGSILGRQQYAGLRLSSGTVFAASYLPSWYGLHEVSTSGIGIATFDSDWGWRGSITALWAGSARRMQLRAGGGHRLGDILSVGVGASVAQWTFPRYGSVFEWEGIVGAMVTSSSVSSGLSLTAWGQEGRSFAMDNLRITAGCSLRLSEEVEVIAEVMDWDGIDIRMGAQLTLLDELRLILSWSDGIGCVGSGVDVRAGAWTVLIGTRWHPVLGWSHGGNLQLAWR